jgi:murein L,D-transpeptidase YcbB/YkuD
MMGTVNFIFPNELGIYLHDTPNKAAFTWPERTISAGCVRVEDAPRLAKWLYGRTPPKASAPEQRADLPEPVPVYITYLTAIPRPEGGVMVQKDVYGRDPTLMAALAGRLRPAGAVQTASRAGAKG